MFVLFVLDASQEALFYELRTRIPVLVVTQLELVPLAVVETRRRHGERRVEDRSLSVFGRDRKLSLEREGQSQPKKVRVIRAIRVRVSCD